MDGSDATDKFSIATTPQLSGITVGSDNSLTLAAAGPLGDSLGSASYLIIPDQDAAPVVATTYSVSGTLQYTESDGTIVDVQLLPNLISVYPSPELKINYFWPTQAEGQNAQTPDIVQPAVPFDVGVQVTNIGYAAAKNLTLTSDPPKIIQNATGALEVPSILGSTVNGQPDSPSLSPSFGTIEAGGTGTAAFVLSSTLAGSFQSLTATYNHQDALGGGHSSLIDSVSIHNLVHMVQAGYVGNPSTAPVQDDGVQDFLVSDLPGSNGYPDTLYLSNGTTQGVTTEARSGVTITPTGSPDVYQITATMPAGWGYFDVVDPTAGNLSVGQVSRPDGLLLRVGDNAWTTAQNISNTGKVTAESDLHILDYNATATTVTYSITFYNPNAVTPTITSLQQVKPALRSTAVSSLTVTLNEPINLATFTNAALALTLNSGPNLINSGVTISLVSGSTYQINGLGALTSANGPYRFSVNLANVQDNLGDVGTGSQSTQWTMDAVHTTVFVENAPSLTNTPVTTFFVDYSRAINSGTFGIQALGLTLNGGTPLDLSSGVTIANISAGRYEITLASSLTTNQGTYVFTVNPAGVVDINGDAIVGTDATQWTMDTTAPSITSLQQPQSPRNIVVPTITVTFSKAIDPSTFGVNSLSLTLNGSTTNLLTTFPNVHVTITPVTGTLAVPNTYQIGGINLPQSAAGTYTLTISNSYIKDYAGNLLAAPMTSSWGLNLTSPAAPTGLAITPDFGLAMDGQSRLTNTEYVTLMGTVSVAGLEVRITDDDTSNFLSNAIVNGTSWSRTLELAPGEHDLQAEAFDPSANGSTVTDLLVYVDVTPPTVDEMDAVTPNQRVIPVATENLELNKFVSTFDYHALSLTLNGAPVTIPSTVTVNVVTGDTIPTYQISGLSALTATPGNYVLTVNAGQIIDAAHNVGTASSSVSWTQVSQIADLTITNAVDNLTPHPGGIVHFTVTVTGAGPLTSTHVSVTEILPTGLAFQSSSLTAGTYNTTSGVWSIPQLNVGQTVTLIVSASLNTSAGGQTLVDLATISSEDQVNQNSPTSAEVDLSVQPTSFVGSLPVREATGTFIVPVTLNDPSGAVISSVDLYVSQNNAQFTKYRTLATNASTGIVNFSFTALDRNTYAFYSVAHEASNLGEIKSNIEASTYVPDLSPPVTHALAASPVYSWNPFSTSIFSGLTASSYGNGMFTVTWAGADPDQTSGTPAGKIVSVSIYAKVDSAAVQLVGTMSAGSPNTNGVYTGSTTFAAVADGLAHTYSFYTVGIDDQSVTQSAPATPDVTFVNISYAASLTASLVVEKGLAERSYVRYLDVFFNQPSSNAAMQRLAAGVAGSQVGSYVQVLWFGENLTANSASKGSVTVSGKVSFVGSSSGSELSIDFGTAGITSLLTETGVSGTGTASTAFGDGWFALGIDPNANPSLNQVFWIPFFRLLGDVNGGGIVTGPAATANTDLYVVSSARGTSGSLLNADVNGDGTVNTTDLSLVTAAYNLNSKNNTVGSTMPRNFPQFQVLDGPAGSSAGAAITQSQVEALLPQALLDWQLAGLNAAGLHQLEQVRIEVGDLGSNILGLEDLGTISINDTAAGYAWYIGSGSDTNQAFALAGPGGELVALPSSLASGQADLLTVLEHELGHVVGLADNSQAGDLMDISLGLGQSRRPSRGDVTSLALGYQTTLQGQPIVAFASHGKTAAPATQVPANVDAGEGAWLGQSDFWEGSSDTSVTPAGAGYWALNADSMAGGGGFHGGAMPADDSQRFVPIFESRRATVTMLDYPNAAGSDSENSLVKAPAGADLDGKAAVLSSRPYELGRKK